MTTTSADQRFTPLDQFRGYTVLVMFLVNFVGSYHAVRAIAPTLAHHHTYCSYADTIMPQFFFAVGFAYRWTFQNRVDRAGSWSAIRHAVRRNLTLLLIAFAVHSVGSRWESWSDAVQRDTVLLRWAKQDLFQTLTHIAVTSLWVLPVIGRSARVRILWAVLSGIGHLAISYAFNYRWCNTPPNGVDGGPLGFLTWTIPLVVGSLAADWVRCRPDRPPIAQMFLVGLLIALSAVAISGLVWAPHDLDRSTFSVAWKTPGVPLVHVDQKPPTNNLLTMSQRSGSVTYLLFGAGFAVMVFAGFMAVDRFIRIQVGMLRTLGTNALVGYVAHGLVNMAIKPLVPRDAPLIAVSTACMLSILFCYLFLRSLEKQRITLRL